MTQTNGNGGRRYGGLDQTERARQRRGTILEAATDLFANPGYRHTSVKQICDRAGLTQRYFYESFADREDALVARYDELVGQLRADTLVAIESVEDPDDLDLVIERALSAFVDFLTIDTRRAQIVLIEVVGVSQQLETRRHAVLHDFADIVTSAWLGRGRTASQPQEPTAQPQEPTAQHRKTTAQQQEPTAQQRLMAVALVGGVHHLLVDWLLGGKTQQPAELTRTCITLFTGAKQQLTPPAAPPPG